VSSTSRFRRGGMTIVLLPVSLAPAAERRPRIITESTEDHLWNAGMSPNGKWICFQATKEEDSRLAGVRADANRASRAQWMWLTSDVVWIDKPRWSADGRIIYYVSRRGGIFNVWGIGFNPTTGTPSDAFQITHFDG
jgi:Tol biopolymer transport system component